MAVIKVKVSSDNMVASINLLDDGKEVTKIDLEKILNENNVVYGIRSEILKEIELNPKYNVDIPVAYGKGPETGGNGSIEILSHKKEINMEKHYINMRERSNIISVEKDDKLAKINPPTQGEPGKDVYGTDIEGFHGKEIKVKLGKNVDKSGNYIIALFPGELIYKKEANGNILIDVSRVYTIDGDIDYSTGNVRFPGKVVVNGNVKPGFTVEAEGDIEILGVIESSTVIATEKIIVSGIKGANKGIIKAKNIEANYIENADIEADEIVLVKQSIINSKVKAGKEIILTSDHSKITGGTLNSGLKIEAAYIGSERNVKTHVEVGIDPKINEEITILNSQIAIDLENLRKISLILKGLTTLKKTGKLTSDKIDQYRKSLETAKTLKSSLEEKEIRLNQLKEVIEGSENKGIIVAKTIIYPGAEIFIHKKSFFPSKAMTKSVFFLDEDKIVLRGYTE